MFWLFGDDKPVPPRPEEEGTGNALREDEEPEKAVEDPDDGFLPDDAPIEISAPDPEEEESGEDPADGGSAETGGEEFELFSEESDADFQSGVFINSLDQLEEEDIPLSEHAAEAERVSVFEYIRRVMFWFFLAAFVVSMFLLIRNGIQKRKAAQIYREIQEEFFSAGFSFDASEAFRTDRAQMPGLEEDTEQRTIHTMTELLAGAENEAADTGEARIVQVREHNEEFERMRAALQNMIRKNPDVYGWLSVPGTNINYPLAKGADNDYYLNHAVNGEYNPVGCIFVDYRCDRSVTKNFNTVCYGHNIQEGAMLHDVTKFFNEEYFKSINIYVYTLDGIYEFEPFAVYEAAYDDEYFRVSFESAEDFVAFAEDAQRLGTHDKGFRFTDKDRILTLSTCTNGYWTQRFALHAKLVRATVFD